jgi:hypothetical protein
MAQETKVGEERKGVRNKENVYDQMVRRWELKGKKLGRNHVVRSQYLHRAKG